MTDKSWSDLFRIREGKGKEGTNYESGRRLLFLNVKEVLRRFGNINLNFRAME